MRRSSHALMLLLPVAALAVPVLAGLACDTGVSGGATIRGDVDRGACPLAACGSGPGVICRRAF